MSARRQAPGDEFPQMLERVRAGSEADVAELLDQYRPYLKRLARRNLHPDVRPKEGSSDVVQMTVIDGQLGFKQCRATTPASFRLWLRKILINNLHDLHRRYVKSPSREVGRERSLAHVEAPRSIQSALAHSDTPSKEFSREERDRLVQTALAQLKPEYQEAIYLRYQDNLTYEEIGEILGKTTGSAQSLVKYAVYKLGLSLSEDPGVR